MALMSLQCLFLKWLCATYLLQTLLINYSSCFMRAAMRVAKQLLWCRMILRTLPANIWGKLGGGWAPIFLLLVEESSKLFQVWHCPILWIFAYSLSSCFIPRKQPFLGCPWFIEVNSSQLRRRFWRMTMLWQRTYQQCWPSKWLPLLPALSPSRLTFFRSRRKFGETKRLQQSPKSLASWLILALFLPHRSMEGDIFHADHGGAPCLRVGGSPAPFGHFTWGFTFIESYILVFFFCLVS